MACGDGGSEDQLSCAVELSGLTDGTWYFAVEAYDVFGGTSAPSGEVSKAISCGMNGANCTSGADCPPFQACDTTKGVCSSVCDAGNCACNSDRQCNGGYMSQLAPLGTEAWFGVGLTCRNSLCVPGCANAGDCPLGMGCDLATGSCVSDCQGNACACDVDSQCRGIYGTEIGYSCTACGTCAQQCKSARDCDGTHACDLSSGFPGTCGTNCPNCLCETDSQCNGGQTGLNVICSGGDGSDIPTPSMPGHCIPGCHYASDCDATQACTAFCVDPTSCGDGVCQTVCDAGCQCLNSQQCNGGNSGLGLFCEPDAGQCIPGCSANSDCASGICNLTNYPGTCQ